VTTLPVCMRLLRSNVLCFQNYFFSRRRSYVCILSDLSLLQIMCVLHILHLSLQVRSPPQTKYPFPYLPGTSHSRSRIMFRNHGKNTSVVAEHGATSSLCPRFEGPSGVGSVRNKWPELVVQTLAAISFCWCRFPDGGVCNYRLRPQLLCGNSRCCGVSKMHHCRCGGLWIASSGGLGTASSGGLWTVSGGPWTVSGCMFVMPAVMPPGVKDPRFAPVGRLSCRVLLGRCLLW
jgi:hypothetical protein